MAFSGGSRGPSASVSEINVTPLVDVMLVLLIIFMISAPMLQSGVDIDLPLGNNELQAKEKHMILSLNAEGKAYLNGDYLQPELILDKVKAAVLTAPGQTIYLEADQQLPYGKVAEMLSQLREQGIEKVSLITEPPQTGKR